ncbi:hypothetical protein JHK82_057362 [Glycine max]|uniref:Uncharacterized protein n=2 Tax=Glycine subgen. Soja TaxID=1462606 RepID=K7N5G3_SOYBN|nr:hypothetical protein JHK85_058220 [Glycine max]KAG5078667.1 hypothetical protein JHK82_057362 [Glycine max]KRG93052.1 hypothetical protein GLYMA_20G245700v4 [Glycine max]RZB45640.1 hypothetical protein D0Y65_055084 [Glycine soja]
MAALAATFSANFFFLSKAWFALAISCSLFISFSFAGSISHSLAGASFWGFSNSYSSVSATSLLSGLDFKSLLWASAGFGSSRFLIRPSRLNCRISNEAKILFS